jgi:hypothetical protein
MIVTQKTRPFHFVYNETSCAKIKDPSGAGRKNDDKPSHMPRLWAAAHKNPLSSQGIPGASRRMPALRHGLHRSHRG